GVPAGMCAPGGTTELVGEIPPRWASRSKGSRASSDAVAASGATTGTDDWWSHAKAMASPRAGAKRPMTLEALMAEILPCDRSPHKSQGRCQPVVVENR